MPTDDQRRVIGKVISVTADKLVIELPQGNQNFTVVGFDDVHYVARLGSFVMIPVQSEYVVAEVVGLREKDAPPSHRTGDVDADLDKSTSAKYLDVVPLGMLPQRRDGAFKFGVSVFPSLYANALYVLDAELDRIFDVDVAAEPAPNDPSGGSTRLKALTIGTSIIFDGYDIKARVDEFFGGHIAVLGNTGSGKSCTVATILQSLFVKPDAFSAAGATFIVLDVNGEYRQALCRASCPHQAPIRPDDRQSRRGSAQPQRREGDHHSVPIAALVHVGRGMGAASAGQRTYAAPGIANRARPNPTFSR